VKDHQYRKGPFAEEAIERASKLPTQNKKAGFRPAFYKSGISRID